MFLVYFLYKLSIFHLHSHITPGLLVVFVKGTNNKNYRWDFSLDFAPKNNCKLTERLSITILRQSSLRQLYLAVTQTKTRFCRGKNIKSNIVKTIAVYRSTFSFLEMFRFAEIESHLKESRRLTLSNPAYQELKKSKVLRV